MTKRCIGIDFNSSHIHAVQMARVGNRPQVEKIFNAPRHRQFDSPVQIVHSLVSKHGFDRRAGIALSADHKDLYFRNIPNDTKSENHNQKLLDKNDFPVPADELVTANYSRQSKVETDKTTLVAAINKNSLKQRLDTMNRARMGCELMDAPVFAIYTAVTTNHPEITASPAIIIYSDSSHIILAVTSNNDILIVRNIPNFIDNHDNEDPVQDKTTAGLLSEIEITWRAAFRKKIPENTPLVFAGSISQNTDLISALQHSLNCKSKVVDLSSKIDTPTPSELTPEFAIAQGLALRTLSPKDTNGINFVNAHKNQNPKNTGFKKQLIVATVLLTALVSVSLIGLFVRKARMEKEYAHIKQQIRQIFVQTLPEEQNIVNEPAQLEARFETLRKNTAHLEPLSGAIFDPLEVLRAISINTPDQLNVKVTNIRIDSSSITLQADCDSYQTVQKWQALLRNAPGFNSVDIQHTNKDPDTHRIKFTAIISSGREQL